MSCLSLQRLRHVAGDDPLGETLDHRGLADAGLADQHRVVLGAAGQHLDHPADLGVAADDRVDAALAGPLGQVDAVLFQRLIGGLRVRGGDPPVPATDRGERLEQRVGGGTGLGQQLAGVRAGAGQGDQQVLGRAVLVADRGHDLLGAGQDVGDGAGDLRLGHGRPGRPGQGGDQAGRPGADRRRVGADRAQQTRARRALGAQQRDQQVSRLDDGVPGLGSAGERGRDDLAALGGEDLGVHRLSRRPSGGCSSVVSLPPRP
jgi:hypothetical protein